MVRKATRPAAAPPVVRFTATIPGRRRRDSHGRQVSTQAGVEQARIPVEKDFTVTMTLKNLSSSTINLVYVTRSGDFYIGASS